MAITKACSVQFTHDGRKYAYGVPEGMELNPDDLVVVHTNSHDSDWGFKIVKVVEVDVEVTQATKYIVDKIDLETHRQEMARRERIKVLKSKLDAKAKEIHDRKKYELLEEDPDGAAMLRELKALEGH